ncbi:transposable element Tcb2 transposase [Trichonephila clavipes]|nr:transposable element Tcb2 transposase [Trichonephila clavipes]
MWNVTDWQKVVFSDESQIVFGTDDNRVRVWRRLEDVWDQLKRQMPSCHSVHDLELAVQDLWAHLPQDNKVSNQLNAGPSGGMYCSWMWSNALLKLPSICVVAHPVFV